MDGRAVLGDPLREQVHDLVTSAFVLGAVVARNVTRHGALEGRTDAVKDVGTSAARAAGAARLDRGAGGPCDGRRCQWSAWRCRWTARAAPPFPERLGGRRG